MSKEQELCFYAMVTEPSGFELAVSSEIHEQYEYRIPTEDGSKKKQRVRATTRDGVIIYEQALKVYCKDSALLESCLEPSVQITKEYFDIWKKAFGVKGVKKIRYVFLSKNVELEVDGKTIQLPEVKYEVDIMLDLQGNRSKWCKIDIELDKILAYLADQHPEIKKFDNTVKLSTLPFKPQHAFSATSDNEEHKKAADAFWAKFRVHGD